ncbi:type II toxin-antitoxin system RelE/ParE family toxin [Halopenitus salinus]|uniref:Type II toxin-antitoxin system RelE/ParE family toxin n=1 Tax=Halopenitus salinus TaxID=1198295 RepID=A0ABD5UPW5_9EURY
MGTSDENWDWKFTDPAEREYGKLQPHDQERIVSKLDEIVTDQWREPSDYLEPLTGAPHSKLRIGAFRLGCKAVHADRILWVHTIEKRSGAYKPGDD